MSGQDRVEPGAVIGAVISIVGLILLIAAWRQGTFDRFLYQFGLNAKPCAQNFFGVVLCGDDLVEFCRQFYDPELNAHVCDQVLK